MNKSDKLILEFYRASSTLTNNGVCANEEQCKTEGWGEYELAFNAMLDRGKELHQRQMEKASIATDEHD